MPEQLTLTRVYQSLDYRWQAGNILRRNKNKMINQCKLEPFIQWGEQLLSSSSLLLWKKQKTKWILKKICDFYTKIALLSNRNISANGLTCELPFWDFCQSDILLKLCITRFQWRKPNSFTLVISLFWLFFDILMFWCSSY